MDNGAKITPEVLFRTARVQAALSIIPHIVGPKEVWMPWFRDQLSDELTSIPNPDPNSPHPRLMGSARRVLLDYYSSGMVLDTLDFGGVQWNDVLVAGDDCYVDIRDVLLEPVGEDLWWQKLPPSVSLRDSQVPPNPSFNALTPAESMLSSNTDEEARMASPTLDVLEGASDPLEGSDSGLNPRKGKKRVARGRTSKRKKTPHVRTKDPGLSIRPLRGKQVALRSLPPQGNGDSLAHEIAELNERVTGLEERFAADQEQQRDIRSRVAILEFQVKLLTWKRS